MARKVIIDCDPGIDDAVALALAFFDPRLEVIAVTATAGNVAADQAARNVQATVEQLDPPRFPRVGTALAPESSPGVDGRALHGDDGLGNASIAVSRLQHQHPSDKILCDEIRAAPGEVTIVCTGPLTNVARALKRDPGLVTAIGRLIITGGSVHVGGDATAAAEFNMYYDPESARQVFQSPTTKTLIPLDVTRQLTFSVGLLHELPREFTRAGAFLRKILPYAFRAYHQCLGRESIQLQAVIGLLAALEPSLFKMVDMAGDVETHGHITMGATVFDRRQSRSSRSNMEVAMDLDAAGAMQEFRRGLEQAGHAT